MSHMSHTRPAAHGAFERVSDFAGGLRTRFQQYCMFRETLSDLSALTDRELTDLGIRRTDLRRVARDAAYRQF